MVNALKKMDKKILIIFGLIIGLPIFIIVFLAIFQGCSNSKISYEDYEEKMKTAAQQYFSEKELNELEESEVATVSLKKLVSEEKIKSSEKLLNDSTCKGNVTVRKNGSTIEKNEGGFFNYVVSLKCDNYETKTLKNSLLNELTTTGSGLYEQNNNYIFRGEEVNNYVDFFGTEYRIISMSSDGVLKLIKSEVESLNKYWDIKYNTEVENSYGKNIYADSNILKELLLIYSDNKKISKAAKERIMSRDLCVDNRAIGNLSLTRSSECNNVLENQVISLIDVVDFANASLDPECVDIKSKSCRNYNYLHGLHLNTWTYVAVSDNTYQVYSLSNGIIGVEQANKYLPLNLVIFIDGNEKYESGEGSETNPFVIK